MSLGFLVAARETIREGWVCNSGSLEIERLYQSLSLGMSLPTSFADAGEHYADVSWHTVAQYLEDCAILQLVLAKVEIRNCIVGRPFSRTLPTVLSQQNGYEHLWQRYPLWVVAMLVNEMSRCQILANFTFTTSRVFQQFMYSAHVLTAWAHMKEALSRAFAVFHFDSTLVQHFLAQPLGQMMHRTSSNLVEINEDITISLTLTDYDARNRADGFSLGVFSERIHGNYCCLLATCIQEEFVMIGTFAHPTMYSVRTVHEGTPLLEAISEGQPLPFMVAIFNRRNFL